MPLYFQQGDTDHVLLTDASLENRSTKTFSSTELTSGFIGSLLVNN